jgi:hypothetical protein
MQYAFHTSRNIFRNAETVKSYRDGLFQVPGASEGTVRGSRPLRGGIRNQEEFHAQRHVCLQQQRSSFP